MNIQEVIQEFEDNLYHPSLKPNISTKAKILALKALKEYGRIPYHITITENNKDKIPIVPKETMNECVKIFDKYLTSTDCNSCKYKDEVAGEHCYECIKEIE